MGATAAQQQDAGLSICFQIVQLVYASVYLFLSGHLVIRHSELQF